MQLFTILDIIAIILIGIHFGVPLIYYWYAKTKWLPRPWNIKTDPNYQPKITIIIPTYNEAKHIENKLDNIQEQNYPRDRLEVIVIDSASTDGTPEKVNQWANNHPDLKVLLVKEPVRKGMAHALRTALKYAKETIVIVTDVDAMWVSRDTLREVTRWLSCEKVGAVSCVKTPSSDKPIEYIYRQYYNVLRLAESKAWSTPIFHGELSAFRRGLLDKIGGFPLGVGSAESLAAMKIVALGYRAIVPSNMVVQELVPKSGKEYMRWRTRRAQHLIIHITKSLNYLKNYTSIFKKIVLVEAYLHLLNPWLFILGMVVLLSCALSQYSILAQYFIVLGLALLVQKTYRTWITNQFFLILAQIRSLWNKELVWRKEEKV